MNGTMIQPEDTMEAGNEGLLIVTITQRDTGLNITVTVCNDDFSWQAADLFCQYFGFSNGEYTTRNLENQSR